jgi:hypothetical protein
VSNDRASGLGRTREGFKNEVKGPTLLGVLRARRGLLAGRVIVLVVGAVSVLVLVELVVRLVIEAVILESLAREVVDRAG